MKVLIGVAVLALVSSAVAFAQIVPAPAYYALKTKARAPAPDNDGIVTVVLASGAFVKVRAQDIDYDRTAAYETTLVVKPNSLIKTADGKALTLFFNRGDVLKPFAAAVWTADVDDDVMRSGFAAYVAREKAAAVARSVLSSDEKTIREKCAKDWPDDFVMREYCEKIQREALTRIR